MTAASRPPVVNTHVHVPPNFSAFSTPEQVVEAASAEDVRALGISNFYDQQVYARFADLAVAAGIVPLFGLEFITLDPALEAASIKVNDPANPGRMYLCGKGINPFKEKSPIASTTASEIRHGNDDRAGRMLDQVRDHLASVGLVTDLASDTVARTVAERGSVPREWVSLQERHIARAVEEAVTALPLERRQTVLAAAYGIPSTADVTDPASLQAEIRSRLLKVGTPGFVAEVPLSFDQAYAYVLEMDGIPTYPTLADGVSPICPFEDPASELAAKLVARGIHAAELIPIRNTVACVDAYVRAFTDAGLIVMAGTEHNTPERIPLDPACVDGPVSDASRQAFWEGTCVVAAHQHLNAAGEPGFVDATGALVGGDAHRARLIDLGAQIIAG